MPHSSKRVDDHLGVGVVGAEDVAEPLELRPQLGVVVDLAVEDEPDASRPRSPSAASPRRERSMIASRRKPRPTRPSAATQVPAPSGPRCAIASRIRVTYGSS